MSWSTELWDQFDTISSHTSKGVEFLDKLGHFVKERCLIEVEYASRLRKLVKNHDLKKKDDDEKEFSYCKAFRQMIREISDMAGQHEVIAENMSSQIVKEISLLSRELRDERKKYLSDGVKNQNVLTSSLNQLDKSKKAYDKAFKESEKAQDNFQKADADLNLSRAEVEKSRTISLTKDRACEDFKTEYAKQLQTANNYQREHYHTLMPKIFLELQDMEDRRIDCIRNFIKLSAILQRNVAPIIDKCLQGIIDSAEKIDSQADTQLVIDRYKSGMQPPDDIPFEDLSISKPNGETDSNHSKGSNLAYSRSLKSDSLRHTLSARGLKKRSKIFGIFANSKFINESKQQDFSDLPPNQKRKKLQAKLDQLRNQYNQENAVREGLITMKQAYSENGNFGDPLTIESQLRENQITLKRLKLEIDKYQSLIGEIDCNLSPANSERNDLNNSQSESQPNLNHRNSSGAESSNSDTSLRPDSNREATKSSATTRTSNSFNDSTSDSISNAPPTYSDVVDGDQITDDIVYADEDINNKTCESAACDPVEIPIQGTARALYPFKAEPEGSISMTEGETFDVIESDQGDGWTRVRRVVFQPDDKDFIGFVPTSYIEIELTNVHNPSN